MRRVALGPFSDLHSISPSGRYVLALRKRLTSAVAKLVDLGTGRSRVLAGATVRYSGVDDPSAPLPHDDLVRWTPDERTIVLNAGTELFAADVASGRTLRLSIPPLPHPVYFLRLETVAGDSRTRVRHLSP